MTACSVEEAANGFAVCRDGKPIKTPAGKPLIVPSRALADAITGEEPGKKPGPFLQLVYTAIDIIAPAPEKAIEAVTGYAASDLLCHRAEQPPELARKQNAAWQPLLDWLAKEFKAPLASGAGVMPIPQAPQSVEALRRAVAAYDAFPLAGLGEAVRISGSLVIGLALMKGRLSGEQAFHTAELDSEYQMKDWGEDPASKARREAIRQELNLYQRWFELLRA